MPSKFLQQQLGGPGEAVAGHQQVDVAEHPLARIVVHRVRECHTLQYPRGDAGAIECPGRVEQEALHPERVSEPGPVLQFEAGLLLGCQQDGTVAYRLGQETEEPVVLAGGTQSPEVVVGELGRFDHPARGKAVGRDRRRGDRHRPGRAFGRSASGVVARWFVGYSARSTNTNGIACERCRARIPKLLIVPNAKKNINRYTTA